MTALRVAVLAFCLYASAAAVPIRYPDSHPDGYFRPRPAHARLPSRYPFVPIGTTTTTTELQLRWREAYGYLYHVSLGLMNFYEAENYCKMMNAEVAYVNMLKKESRNKILALFSRDLQVLIGVRYAFRAWRSQDTKPVRERDLGWAEGEPNNMHFEDCVHTIPNSPYLNNISCRREYRVICEKKA